MHRDCGGEIWERRVENVNGGWRGDCHCLTVDEGVGVEDGGLGGREVRAHIDNLLSHGAEAKASQLTVVVQRHMDAIDHT